MKTEILEKRCAEALLGYSQTMADAYTTEPEDSIAAVTALGFDYGQKHKVELERAQSLVAYVNEKNCGCGGKEIYGKVNHQIIKLDGLSQLLNSALVEGGNDVPEGHYEQDNMKDTVVPNRNKIFSSLIQAVALSAATVILNNDCEAVAIFYSPISLFIFNSPLSPRVNILTERLLIHLYSIHEPECK